LQFVVPCRKSSVHRQVSNTFCSPSNDLLSTSTANRMLLSVCRIG
jgi:hypothetical protein